MCRAFFADLCVWLEDAAHLAPATFGTAFRAEPEAFGWSISRGAIGCLHSDILGGSELDRGNWVDVAIMMFSGARCTFVGGVDGVRGDGVNLTDPCSG